MRGKPSANWRRELIVAAASSALTAGILVPIGIYRIHREQSRAEMVLEEARLNAVRAAELEARCTQLLSGTRSNDLQALQDLWKLLDEATGTAVK